MSLCDTMFALNIRDTSLLTDVIPGGDSTCRSGLAEALNRYQNCDAVVSSECNVPALPVSPPPPLPFPSEQSPPPPLLPFSDCDLSPSSHPPPPHCVACSLPVTSTLAMGIPSQCRHRSHSLEHLNLEVNEKGGGKLKRGFVREMTLQFVRTPVSPEIYPATPVVTAPPKPLKWQPRCRTRALPPPATNFIVYTATNRRYESCSQFLEDTKERRALIQEECKQSSAALQCRTVSLSPRKRTSNTKISVNESSNQIITPENYIEL